MNKYRVKTIAAAVIAAAVIGTSGWYILTHGIVLVSREGSPGDVIIRQADGRIVKRFSEKSAFAFVPSGVYSAAYSTANGQEIQTLEVPQVLGRVRLTVTEPVPRRTERVAVNALPYLIPAGNEIISAAAGPASGIVLVHPPTDPNGYGTVTRSFLAEIFNTTTSNGKLLGFSYSPSDSGDGNGEIFPLIANTATGGMNPANRTYNSRVSPVIVGAGAFSDVDYFGVAVRNDSTMRLDYFTDAIFRKSIANLPLPAQGKTGPALSMSSGFIAIGTGSNYSGDDQDFIGKSPSKPARQTPAYTVAIYGISPSAKVATVNLGPTTTVAGMQINNTGDKLAVDAGNNLTIYDTKTSLPIVSYPIPTIISSTWISDTRLIVESAASGFLLVDTDANKATTLFTATGLRLNAFTTDGKRILFTAIVQDIGKAKRPDGYVIYLNEPSTDNNQLVRAFPDQTDKYKFQAVGSTIFAAKNLPPAFGRDVNGNFAGPQFRPVNKPDSEFKDGVTAYLKKKLKDYQRYTVVYGENL